MDINELKEALTAPITSNGKPVVLYTKAEASKVMNELGYLDTITFSSWDDRNLCAVFFPSNYCFQSKLLPGGLSWVHSSTTIPHQVVPRPLFEDGMIRTVDDYLNLYHGNENLTVLESLDDLLSYCNGYGQSEVSTTSQ